MDKQFSPTSVVAVGSLNPVKIQAVATAIERIPLRASVISRAVPSGVSDQPMTTEETLQGSMSRAIALLDEMMPDYAVGLEGGLTCVLGEWFCTGFATVATRSGLMRSAMSPGVWVPPGVMDLINEGMELGDAEDAYYNTKNSKQSSGLIGIITGGLILREETFLLPVITAFCSVLDVERRHEIERPAAPQFSRPLSRKVDSVYAPHAACESAAPSRAHHEVS